METKIEKIYAADASGESLQAGAKTIAVSSAVTQSANPKEVCRQLKEKILAFQNG